MKVTPEQRASWLESTAQSPFNQWLDGQIRDAGGKLDLDALHAVARAHGIDRQSDYAHLNPGQQRMNIGNLLRRVVPPSVYESIPAKPPLSPATAPPSVKAVARPKTTIEQLAPSPASVGQPAPVPIERPSVIREASVLDLLRMHGQIIDELRERKIIRTGNAPLGDYAELLFATAFGWTLSDNSAAGHDAIDERGVRYQIKARRVTSSSKSRQLSAIRKLPDKTFDMLAAVTFDADYQVQRAILLPHAEVEARASRVEHTNSWRLSMDDRVWNAAGAVDVTKPLAMAALKI
jgi:hypothetical protein